MTLEEIDKLPAGTIIWQSEVYSILELAVMALQGTLVIRDHHVSEAVENVARFLGMLLSAAKRDNLHEPAAVGDNLYFGEFCQVNDCDGYWDLNGDDGSGEEVADEILMLMSAFLTLKTRNKEFP